MFVTPEPHVPPVMAVISPIYTDLFAQKPPETMGKLGYYRGEREKETEREIHTDRQKDRETDKETEKEREGGRQRDRDRDNKRDKQIVKKLEDFFLN